MDKETELVITLSKLSNKISRRLDSHLSVHGISFTEYLVLSHLSVSHDQQSRRIDVASSVGLTASGVTRLLAPMEKIGLITKEKAQRDARVSLVKLTESGERIFTEAQITVSQATFNQSEMLSSLQRATLLEYMQKML